ncbi:MAG TPA: TonB-dependent receptor [Vicinamibacteria bacterium]|jgi:iron complex outermembrane receptor protein
MTKPPLPALLLAAALLPAPALLAQEAAPSPPAKTSLIEKLSEFHDFEDLELDELLNVTISIAAGRTQTLEEAPSIVSVVTDEDIHRMGARTLEEVLETVPGIEVLTDATGHGRITIRAVIAGFTSGSSENALVLFNGHRLNEDVNGGATFVNLDIPVDNIKKIEIIRGPGSALFGANAFLGVINIVTYNADTFKGLEVSAGGGSFDTKQASVLFGRTAGEVSLSGFAQWSDTNGPRLLVPADVQTFTDLALRPFGIPPASLAPGRTQDDRRTFDANASLVYQGLTLSGRFKDEDAGGYIGFVDNLGTRSRNKNQQLGLYADYHRSLGAKSNLRSSFTFNQSTEELVIEAFPPGAFLPSPVFGFVRFPDGIIDDLGLGSRRVGGEASVDTTVFRGNTATFGAGWDRESTYDLSNRGNFDPLTRLPAPSLQPLPNIIPDAARRVFSLFAQDTWSPTPRVGVTAGVRRDDYSDFGSTVNPRAALVLRLPSDFTLKLLYGRAFRAPTFLELFFNFTGFIGNPSLKPSTINTFEVALGFRRPRLRASVNAYANSLRNFIVPERPFNPGESQRFINLPGIDARGVELEVVRSFGSRHALRLGYAYQHPEDKVTKQRLADIPTHLASLQGTLGIGRYLSLTPTLLVRGSRPRALVDRRPELDGYALVNLGVRLRDFYKGLSVSGEVQNLFDKQYFDPSPFNGVPGDYPRPGRTIFVKAGWKF